MRDEAQQKINASHLKRKAYLYVRQSTVRQVFENQESTERQYALRQRAIALGWPEDRIEVIDTDLGCSGSGVVKREGFGRLVSEVGMGRAGIVLGLEVSRLARNSSDWHRLLEICALTDTLILDEDGIYDPAHFNDRLLLGLKGTMSEAELHIIRSRLRGGLLNKARRGELRCCLPIGYVYDGRGKVVKDPDKHVQESIDLLFETFERFGSGHAIVKHFRESGLLFPMRIRSGKRKGELVFKPLYRSRVASILHSPWYAGAYAFGMNRYRKLPNGKFRQEPLPRSDWLVLIKENHPGYISWQQFERNEQRLKENDKALYVKRGQGPPREGPALLQGRVLCGFCGSRMHVHYNVRRNDERATNYVCFGRGREYGARSCQSILGNDIDAAVGKLLVEAVTPMALELTLKVQQEIQSRIDEADRLRHLKVERAQYEADHARFRYMQIDPHNRLVADSLEADWNEKLRALAEAHKEYEEKRSADRLVIDETERRRVLSLAADFPAIWNDPNTPQRERKRMLALLIEDVTLTKGKEVNIAVRFRGGATTVLTVPRPLTSQQLRATDPEVRRQLDELLDEYTDTEVANILNQRGLRTGVGDDFKETSVQWVRYTKELKSLKSRLLDAGWLTRKQMEAKLGVGRTTLGRMRKRGELRARICNGSGEMLYWPNDESPPTLGGSKSDSVGSSTAGGAV